MLTPSEHRARIDALRLIAADMEANPPPMCCLNCDNMEKDRVCVRFGPIQEEYLASPGCPEWIEELPF